ncbi:MAG: hypothetical protein WCG95_08580, partial [bacterium]
KEKREKYKTIRFLLSKDRRELEKCEKIQIKKISSIKQRNKRDILESTGFLQDIISVSGVQEELCIAEVDGIDSWSAKIFC